MKKHPFEAFEQVLIINLVHRDDRRKEMQEELMRLGVRVDGTHVAWLEAERPSTQGAFDAIGAHGCFLSHLKALDHAVQRGLNAVLILEDDACFSGDFLSMWSAVASEPWDMVYGGGVPFESDHALKPGLNPLPSGVAIQTSHFIALRGKKTIADLRDYLQTVLLRERGHPQGGPMHVDGAYSWFRRLNPSVQALLPMPVLSTQRPSRSDITPSRLDQVALLRPFLGAWRSLKQRRRA